ncbi:5-formyltetrahydrofolate cyclo-ligase [Geobacter pickeringii]|uniref:5-formyltetrahydrofolate cyclo-ligase n=1 Tax=Geobacter pickeringii TaxID=345632 RepID=A0A0B5BLH2_9BACT|nr:5-formyltetrahydrofolate cyclo-ligase [Geobacter pickeringii]AJE04901.1 5-formyltetrahydrofolate cyclo-ligase [Geobacter pickeringii]
MPKRAIRQLLLARRKLLPVIEAQCAARRAQQALIATPEFVLARRVILYSPIHGEVDTREIMEASWSAGKDVFLPAVCGEDLRFIRVASEGDFKKGAFGILEPCQTGEALPPGRADIIVLPGVAFDLFGRRIGYGKGYYDRALHCLEGTGRLFGFCYDFQLVDEIAGEPHDVAVDVVITERRMIRPSVSNRSEEVREN